MHSWQICSPHSQVQQNEVCFLQQQHSYCCLCRRRLRLPIFRFGLGIGFWHWIVSPCPARKLESHYGQLTTTSAVRTWLEGIRREAKSGCGSPGNSTLKGSASTLVQLGSSSIMALTQSTSGGTPPVVSS